MQSERPPFAGPFDEPLRRSESDAAGGNPLAAGDVARRRQPTAESRDRDEKKEGRRQPSASLKTTNVGLLRRVELGPEAGRGAIEPGQSAPTTSSRPSAVDRPILKEKQRIATWLGGPERRSGDEGRDIGLIAWGLRIAEQALRLQEPAYGMAIEPRRGREQSLVDGGAGRSQVLPPDRSDAAHTVANLGRGCERGRGGEPAPNEHEGFRDVHEDRCSLPARGNTLSHPSSGGYSANLMKSQPEPGRA